MMSNPLKGLLLLGLSLVACRNAERRIFVLTDQTVFPPAPSPEEQAPKESIQESYFPGTDQLRYTRELLILPGGEIVIHGREAAWFRNGQQEYERFFDHGDATGLWKNWFSDGSPHSEIWCDPKGTGTTTWWYPNGQISSRGPAVAGLKHGAWTHFYEDGTKSSEGAYRRGKRNGYWTFWNELGQATASGRYENGIRVGTWELRRGDGGSVSRGE